ncbi:hypothetical protein KC19_12G180600 [Ceratodon purpureus]|uniref:Protein kinase domain-containing protein n=1 Tax=Ceratodon purpureus TaxID=3225 RepID=A0A8T0GCN5_CERPU|nr:hypothetical protein KC19_12G180600 [Ceratodon purpureus]KAG0555598.1 hypothetical protein KC19_12G180600 [Ceratodon purpureus]
MDPSEEAVEAVDDRRPLSLFVHFFSFLHNFVVLFYKIFLWVRDGASHKGRMKSKDLATGHFLGQGCSGIFYETTWSRSQDSTVKLARKDFPGVKGDIFEREVIRLFEVSNHPNVVKTLGWTVDKRSCSLVMEYVRDDLSSIMRRKKEAQKGKANQPGVGTSNLAIFQLHEAMDIALQIAVGVEYLHDNGVTHGDLKPNNVLIVPGKKGRLLVKVADFGLVETKRRSTLISQRALCFRMIEWSAPELFEDYFCSHSEDLDYLWTESPTGSDTGASITANIDDCPEILITKADSYSFALTCACILGGQMWDAKLGPTKLRRQISSCGLRPKLPSECPETLKSLISSCWDSNPERRPTFSYIRNRLQEIILQEQSKLEEIIQELSNLPAYLEIDIASVEIMGPVWEPERKSRHESNIDTYGWALVHYGSWLGCKCALKIFKSVDRVWNKSELLKEVCSLMELHHPHVVQLMGFAQDEKQCLILMELMDTDLRHFMNQRSPQGKRPFTRVQELDIITQIAKGMYYLHEQQYVHGELKCSNILVKQIGGYIDVKISDLRSSQKLGIWDPVLFRERSKRRRPRWTAPEVQKYGEVEPTHELLKKTDVYGFGMVCYEVVTGKLPFQDIFDDELKSRIEKGDLKQELPDELDPKLRGLIESCWERDPNKRPTFEVICHLLNDARSSQLAVTTKSSGKDYVQRLIRWIPKFLSLIADREEKNATPASTWGQIDVEDGIQVDSDPGAANAVRLPEFVRIDPANLKKVRLIGEGTFAKVYEATWLGCKYAVKTFMSVSPIDLQREVKFLVELRHPSIVRLMGLAVHSDRQCSIVMEFMGCSLRNLIDSQKRKRKSGQIEPVDVVPFEFREAVFIITKIALGMRYLHSRDVIHRDLKADNVLVPEHSAGSNIDVKITDFGVSQLIDSSGSQKPSLGVGTTFWRAPEIFPRPSAGGSDAVGDHQSLSCDLKAADVYSFAMTCYEVVTGGVPLEDEIKELTPSELRLKVVEGLRPTLPSDLNSDLKLLIEECWSGKPEERPTFSSICQKLQRLIRWDRKILGRFADSEEMNATRPASILRQINVDDGIQVDSDPGAANAVRLPEFVRVDPASLKKVRLIGEGSFAKVYEATWLGCNFAVKEFPSSSPSEMQAEVNLLVKLRHPCIVQLIGLAVHTDRQCSIVMELMGYDLRCLIGYRMRKVRIRNAEPKPILHEGVKTLDSWNKTEGAVMSVHNLVQHSELRKLNMTSVMARYLSESRKLKKTVGSVIVSSSREALKMSKTVGSIISAQELKRPLNSWRSQNKVGSVASAEQLRPLLFRDGPFDIHEVLHISNRIAVGMLYLHSRGVAHRDLKATNVLVPDLLGCLDVKIADFGVAQLVDKKRSRLGVGTGFWMAPEVSAWKRPGIKDAPGVGFSDLNAADVYSFAMTCYEVVTGKVPMQDHVREEGLEVVRLKVIEGLRPALPSDLDISLRRLIEECWAADPAKRPTFSTICERLQQIRLAVDGKELV